jgi:hypothetical protein
VIRDPNGNWQDLVGNSVKGSKQNSSVSDGVHVTSGNVGVGGNHVRNRNGSTSINDVSGRLETSTTRTKSPHGSAYSFPNSAIVNGKCSNQPTPRRHREATRWGCWYNSLTAVTTQGLAPTLSPVRWFDPSVQYGLIDEWGFIPPFPSKSQPKPSKPDC